MRGASHEINMSNAILFLQVNAECITLCVIDDCLDSDVPLLEVSLAELKVEQVSYARTSNKTLNNIHNELVSGSITYADNFR